MSVTDVSEFYLKWHVSLWLQKMSNDVSPGLLHGSGAIDSFDARISSKTRLRTSATRLGNKRAALSCDAPDVLTDYDVANQH